MASLALWIDDVFVTINRIVRKLPLVGRLLDRHWSLEILAYLIPLAVLAGLLWLAYDTYERVKYANQRVTQVDDALKTTQPTRESRYCRRIAGFGQEYPSCYATERAGYAAFSRAWSSGKDLGTIRDQLIRCYLEGRHSEGMSWGAAAHCAEADAPGAGTVQ